MRSRCVAAVLAFTAALGMPARSQTPPPGSTSPTPKLTGYLQPRFQTLGDTASYFLRRARFAVEGSITPWATYRAQVELRTIGAAPTPASSPLTLSATDIWIKLTHGNWGGTVGQFRVPWALEGLLGSTTLETTERSRIVNAAKRDIGMQGEWRLPDHIVLQGAIVNGEGPNRAVNPDNRMAYFARAVITPVKGLDVGAAFQGYSDSAGVDAQGTYRSGRSTARAEYIDEHNRRTGVHTRGWYALGAYMAVPRHVELVGRVEQFDPSDRVIGDRETGYLAGVQYFWRGDDFKMIADYEVFREQRVQVGNNRGVIQMQVRW